MRTCFCYVVGGNDDHYRNMSDSIDSIRKKFDNPEFYILELGQTRLSSDGDTIVVHKDLDTSKSKKIGYLFWKEKYNVVLMPDADRIVYVDTDTILVNNNFDDLFEKAGNNIGACQHFWIPTMELYESRAVFPAFMSYYRKFSDKYKMAETDIFWAGGVFLFKNTEENRSVFSEINRVCEEFYSENEYVSGSGLTDELFFSYVVNKESKFSQLGAGMNHCTMGEHHMPLKIEGDILFGKNSFDKEWNPVTFFHCDLNRRDPAQGYNQEINEKIRTIYTEIVGDY